MATNALKPFSSRPFLRYLQEYLDVKGGGGLLPSAAAEAEPGPGPEVEAAPADPAAEAAAQRQAEEAEAEAAEAEAAEARRQAEEMAAVRTKEMTQRNQRDDAILYTLPARVISLVWCPHLSRPAPKG